MRKAPILLRWLEGGLLTAGAALAVWCALVLVEARYFQALPPLAPHQVHTALPSESQTTMIAPGSTATAPGRTTAPGTWIAKLEAPSVRLSATVLEGSDDDTLRRGAGHIEETAFPGQPGNIGIAGHRDTVFRQVRQLRPGDPLAVTTFDRVYHYRIAKTTIVNPNDVHVLDPTTHPTLTLVTCYPFDFIGHAPQRFIVSADLVGHEAR